MARWYSDSGYFPPSRPRTVKGGIRAQSQRGGFGASWWAKRWSAVLDGFALGARMGRGRSYARSGQVLSIDVSEGKIQAKVQGSRPKPYEVKIQVKELARQAWSNVAAAAAAQAIFASKLLAGEMPQEMEEIFRGAGVSLFPERYMDLTTECSCPDWSNPCKHIAAVYYLLGEEFDRDPFLIFRMRGMSREGFLGLLAPGVTGIPGSVPAALPPEPLPAVPADFWKPAVVPEVLPRQSRPVTEAALPRRLGKFPFWRGRLNFHEFLDGVYARASAHAAEVLTADRTSSVQRD
ncbi:MAG: SWIM zinc finger family protein [Acidobacteriia bacterium]|nr:SWIM zinc finger family protein [Terriglobia bacterium]